MPESAKGSTSTVAFSNHAAPAHVRNSREAEQAVRGLANGIGFGFDEMVAVSGSGH